MTKIIVPYDERQQVEMLGAIYDKGYSYFVPNELDINLFSRWNKPKLSPQIVGEDRTLGKNRLYVDWIPSSTWYTNVRSNINAVDWERIKEMCKERASYRCELCRAKANYSEKIFLECHERFLFDPTTRIQKLARFVCMCTLCHQVTHYGLSQVQGREQIVFEHLKAVNRWTDKRTQAHIKNRFDLWERKNLIDWQVDLTLLDPPAGGQAKWE